MKPFCHLLADCKSCTQCVVFLSNWSFVLYNQQTVLGHTFLTALETFSGKPQVLLCINVKKAADVCSIPVNISKSLTQTPPSDKMGIWEAFLDLRFIQSHASPPLLSGAQPEWNQQFGDLQRKKRQPNKELPVVLDTLKLEGVAYQPSVLPGINRSNAILMWPNKTCDSGVLGQQTQQMVHFSKGLHHNSVLQPNSSVYRNTVEHACRRLPTGAGAGKIIYLHTSSSPAVTPLTIWIIPDKPLFEITGLQIKLGHPCKNKQIHESPKKSIFS